jgi:hypothetical protein
VREQGVQIERGPSAGLNLDWERYRYRYDGGRRGALAFLTSAFDPHVEDCWPLELTVWPGGETRRLAFIDFHDAWLEWLL